MYKHIFHNNRQIWVKRPHLNLNLSESGANTLEFQEESFVHVQYSHLLQSLIKSHPCLSLAFTHQVAFVNQLPCQHDSFNLCLKRWKKVISSVFKQFQLWKLDFLTQRVFLSVILIQPGHLSNDFQVIVWNFNKESL